MRISDNTLLAMKTFYEKELIPIYGEGETLAMFETVVEHYLQIPKSKLPSLLTYRLQQSEILEIYDCAKALKKNIPLQHLLGEAWFMNLKFKVNSNVLIPRPETEELCDIIQKENKKTQAILDIGTGSGSIAISLKKLLPNAKIVACDISSDAIRMAKINAKLNSCDVEIVEADVLNSNSFIEQFKTTFDVIVSNPPYILEHESKEMENHVLEHEPHLALFVKGNDPILFYRKIIECCEILLMPNGKLYFELNPLTAKEVESFAKSTGLFNDIDLIKDMSGKLRFFGEYDKSCIS